MTFHKVLCPVDFDENSFAAMEVAADLARKDALHLFVLHVVAVAPWLTSLPSCVDIGLNQERKAQKRLLAVAAQRLTDVAHDVMTRTGDPAIAILHVAQETNADLIVLASHSLRSPHLFPGSVAERVIRQAPCAVMMVKPSRAEADIESVAAQMTRNPETVAPDTTLVKVEEKMRSGGYRFMPVLRDGKLVGIITDRDVRRCFGELENTEVGVVMTEEVCERHAADLNSRSSTPRRPVRHRRPTGGRRRSPCGRDYHHRPAEGACALSEVRALRVRRPTVRPFGTKVYPFAPVATEAGRALS